MLGVIFNIFLERLFDGRKKKKRKKNFMLATAAAAKTISVYVEESLERAS